MSSKVIQISWKAGFEIQTDAVSDAELYETTRVLNCLEADRLLIEDGILRFDLPGESVFILAAKLSGVKKAE